MTKLLEEAFAEAARLSAEAFASSQDEVAGLAKEAAAEDKAGRARPF